MAAVNMHMMSANMPLDFLPLNHPQSRSASVSSRSSPTSRPDSSHGGVPRLGLPPSAEDLYHASYSLGLHHHNSMANDHGRHSSHVYSLPPCEVSSSGHQPPNHNVSNPSANWSSSPKSPSCPCRRITLSTRQ